MSISYGSLVTIVSVLGDSPGAVVGLLVDVQTSNTSELGPDLDKLAAKFQHESKRNFLNLILIYFWCFFLDGQFCFSRFYLYKF